MTTEPIRDDEVRDALAAQLTPEEHGQGVVYVASTAVPAGTTVEFPGVAARADWEAILMFVDRQPLANWGHSCRYLLCRRGTAECTTVEAKLPPFGGAGWRWHVAHRAPGVPDSAVAGT